MSHIHPRRPAKRAPGVWLLAVCCATGAVRGQSNFWLQTDAAASQFGSVTNPVVTVQAGDSTPLYVWFNRLSAPLGFDGVSFDVRLVSSDGGAASAAITIDLPAGRWDGATAGVPRSDSGGTGVDDCNAFDLTNTDTLGATPARFAVIEVTGGTPGTVQLFLCVGSFGIADSGQNAVVRLGFAEGSSTPEPLNVSGGVSGQCSFVAEATIQVIAMLPDFDGDGDVDQSDFGTFQACLTGDNIPQPDAACEKARLDADADVDADDFVRFLACMAGPDHTPACVP